MVVHKVPSGRVRYKQANPITGTQVSGFGSHTGDTWVKTSDGYYGRCEDVNGNFTGDNFLHISQTRKKGSTASYNNRTEPPTSFWWILDNFPLLLHDTSLSHEGVDWVPHDEVVRRILSATGPLTPKVNLPLFVFELRDLPGMLKHAGDLLGKLRNPSGLSAHKEAAAATLAYQFGWAPLLQDLGKLLTFADSVKKRQEELKKAHSSRGLKRKLTIDSGAKMSQWWQYTAAAGYGGPVLMTRETHYKTWATVRWKYRQGQGIGYEPSFNDALRSALGLNLGHIPITVWKSIPWTWMIDWFTDISSVLQANYNMLYYEPSQVNRMDHVTSITRHPAWPTKEEGWNESPIISKGEGELDDKWRQILSPSLLSPTLRVPFLDTFKLSVLGSLAILKLTGR